MQAGKVLEALLPYIILAVFFVISCALRPPLASDEDRYLSVAWEMHLHANVLVPTLNGEPYFSKPPLLFWLIDLAWRVLGAGRAAAMVPVYIVSAGLIALTTRFAVKLFPERTGLSKRMPWIMLGSAVFIIYSTIIAFDLLQTACVMMASLALLTFSEDRRWRSAAAAGVAIGLGILAKGPAMIVLVAAPVIFYPLWSDPAVRVSPARFYTALTLVLVAAATTVCLWLAPAVLITGNQSAIQGVWQQTLDRLRGSEETHIWPVYFYVLLIPVALLPWIVSWDFWQKQRWQAVWPGLETPFLDRRRLLFLVFWLIGLIVVFSLVPSKQPHYVISGLPVLMILFGYCMAPLPIFVFRSAAMLMIVLFSAGHAVAAWLVFPRYDLAPIAGYIAGKPDADWAYLGRYDGELTFLARMKKPFEVIHEDELEGWLNRHPAGFVVYRSGHYPDLDYPLQASQLVDNGYLSVIGSRTGGNVEADPPPVLGKAPMP